MTNKDQITHGQKLECDKAMRPIPGYEGLYSATEDGRIWSHERRGGRGRQRLGGHYMKAWAHTQGYLIVELCKNGRQGTKKVHRIVLQAFKGGPGEGQTDCCHINGIPDDNRLENLRWGTRTQNMEDARRHGTLLLGEASPGAKISSRDVQEIRRLILEGGLLQREIGEMFGVTSMTVSRIKRGVTWTHLPRAEAE